PPAGAPRRRGGARDGTASVPRQGGRSMQKGLLDPRTERDACGVGFVVNVKGERSHDIVQKGLTVLNNLTHRGACGCDPLTGDGAGILVQIPDAFFRRECAAERIVLPAPRAYGVGMVFLPPEVHQRNACERIIEKVTGEEGQTLIS